MKLAATIVAFLLAVLVVLWIAFVRAPPPHEVCAHKAEILQKEASSDHNEAAQALLDQYRLGCRKQAETLLQFRGKIVYARHARCVMAAQTFAEAEGCGG